MTADSADNSNAELKPVFHTRMSGSLAALECLGDGSLWSAQVFGMTGPQRFFDDFFLEDIQQLGVYLRVYRAEAGEVLLREGDVDDYMALVIQGAVDVVRTDVQGRRHPISVAGPGMTLGEMSMIDGKPRFASCIASQTTLFAVLTREALVRVLMDRPRLGAKVLIKLMSLLSYRLRQTSSTLLHYMEGRGS